MAGTATDVLNTACEIDLLRLETESGRLLGHVFDLRCSWQPGEQAAPPRVDEIIYGRTGLLLRLGLSHREPTSVPWSAVRGVRDGVLVVADDAVQERR
jgi:hypothetical protein